MTTVHLDLLGGLRLTVDGQAWPPLTSPRLASLLAAVVLHRPQPLARDQLAAWLWSDIDDAETRRANLRRHLYLLRQALPKDWLLTERDTVQWNPAIDCHLDVDEFTRAARAGDVETCLKAYHGDLLPELYDDWLRPRREALRATLIATLQTASRAAAERRTFDAAIRLAQRLLILDPLLEDTQRDLMRWYAQAGDRSAALQQYESCEKILRDELGVEPDAATTQLYRDILNGPARSSVTAPAPRATAAPVAPPADRIAPTPPRRGLVISRVLIAIALLIIIGFGLLNTSTPAPLETLIITDPAAISNTWITPLYPDSWYSPDDTDQRPHAEYMRTHLQYYGAPYDRVLLRFDLNTLPPNSRIQRAELGVHLQSWIELEVTDSLTQSLPATVGVFEVLTAWPLTATFNWPWQQPGLQAEVDYAATALDTRPITDTAWLTFDVTRAVNKWVTDPPANHGLVLMIVSAPQDMAHYWVDMADQGVPALRPSLRVDYRRGP